jgi:predicted dehydrogenase/threonine dehydrogenase-like Zn-dependent dehydrogenase
MKQILQDLGSGVTRVGEVPCPRAGTGRLLIRTHVSLVSSGTERMLVEFGRGNLLQKARQQPDKVRMVLDKVRTDGLLPTIEAVRDKLDQPIPLGYCNVGTVLEVGQGVEGFAAGDRVVSNGAHAEIVSVPRNLCARVPGEVSDEQAVFTVMGAIGLQGLRLAAPQLGECFVVSGLGLIGLITVQLLQAHGCRVLGIDFDPAKCELARRLGAEAVDLSRGEDPVSAALIFSRGRGVDGVLITASTSSSEPVHQAAEMCRKRGRIVLVGVTGLELSRADFYQKELSFQVSCSYGPGRYDPNYEEKGRDYPIGFVRWTEQRNFEAVLDMMADRRIDLAPLISHRFSLNEAERAYELLASGQPHLGIVLGYDASDSPAAVGEKRTLAVAQAGHVVTPGQPVVGFIGAGNYAMRVLIPAFKAAGVSLHTVSSAGGVTAAHAATKFGFRHASTDTEALLANPEINTVVIATRHDSHAYWIDKALAAGKHVFVEKPLVIDDHSLAELERTYDVLADESKPILMTGFNRRFAPQIEKMKALLDSVNEPKTFVVMVNAGAIPADHWTQDPDVGGGRIIGEGCHFIDLLRFLAQSPIVSVQASAQKTAPGLPVLHDTVSVTMMFADGSMGTVHYLANGHKSFPKERVEVFCAGRVLQLDNFRTLRGYGWPGFRKMNLWRQDKGNTACAAAFADAIKNGKSSPIPFDQLVEVARISIEAAKAVQRC